MRRAISTEVEEGERNGGGGDGAGGSEPMLAMLVEVVLQAEATALKYSAVLKRPGTEGLLDPQDQLGCGDHKEGGPCYNSRNSLQER